MNDEIEKLLGKRTGDVNGSKRVLVNKYKQYLEKLGLVKK